MLFLDEPTTGLDPRSRADLWEVIRELIASGTTLLLTTQYMEEADQLADDIVVIDHGRAIAQGTSQQLKQQVGGERIELVVPRRNLVKIRRVPELLVWILMSPIMFVLLFVYVFGGAIDIPGVPYREWLIAGIFAQTVVFGATFTGVGLAEDMEKGIIDRFRSLPMSRSAVVVGRTVSDIAYNILSIATMALTGLVVGWRIHTSVGQAIGGFLLLLLFSYAFSWVMATVGLLVPSVEVINNASFMVIMPLTFISNAFVPLETFPVPLQRFAEWNPVSAVTQAARDLFGNAPTAADVAALQASGVDVFTPSNAWSLQHPVAYTLAWITIILAVFVPLSVRAYRRSAGR